MSLQPIATTRMQYRRCGRSGLQLPAVSLGLWHNFGHDAAAARTAARSCGARSTSGSPTSTSRTTTGRRTARPRRTSARSSAHDLRPYRDELVISTKAGYDMWPGPYGEWGSRKYLLASLDQCACAAWASSTSTSSTRTASTPRRRSRRRWARSTTAVRQGKALYVGISSYSPAKTREAAAILREPRHAAPDPPAVVLDAEPLDRAGACSTRSSELGVGCIGFSPLAQGVLTDKYLDGIPEGSRASRGRLALARICSPTRRWRRIARAERDRARAAGRRSPQMALAWTLRDPRDDLDPGRRRAASSSWRTNVAALDKLDFADDELAEIDRYATESGINLWAESKRVS